MTLEFILRAAVDVWTRSMRADSWRGTDMAITGETIEALVAAAQAVLRSADDTGCSEDLTVVSQASIQQLQEALWQIRQ